MIHETRRSAKYEPGRLLEGLIGPLKLAAAHEVDAK